jgi:hypothetical protein
VGFGAVSECAFVCTKKEANRNTRVNASSETTCCAEVGPRVCAACLDMCHDFQQLLCTHRCGCGTELREDVGGFIDDEQWSERGTFEPFPRSSDSRITRRMPVEASKEWRLPKSSQTSFKGNDLCLLAKEFNIEKSGKILSAEAGTKPTRFRWATEEQNNNCVSVLDPHSEVEFVNSEFFRKHSQRHRDTSPEYVNFPVCSCQTTRDHSHVHTAHTSTDTAHSHTHTDPQIHTTQHTPHTHTSRTPMDHTRTHHPPTRTHRTPNTHPQTPPTHIHSHHTTLTHHTHTHTTLTHPPPPHHPHAHPRTISIHPHQRPHTTHSHLHHTPTSPHTPTHTHTHTDSRTDPHIHSHMQTHSTLCSFAANESSGQAL